MGLDPAGAAAASLDRQLELVWAHLRAILAAAGMTVVAYVSSNRMGLVNIDGTRRHTQPLPGLAGQAEYRR